MADALDMTLDAPIKKNETSKGGLTSSNTPLRPADHQSHDHRRGRRVGPTRPTRTTPYPLPHAPERQQMSGNKEEETETKLYLSNLDYGVSEDDIWVLFSLVRGLKRYGIHYDEMRRPKGTAEVVYAHKSDALAAVRRYNNSKLDGRPLKIELIGVESMAPPMPPHDVTSFKRMGNIEATDVLSHEMIPQGGGRGLNGPGRGFLGVGQGPRESRGRVSAEDLDADLEKYRSMRNS